MLPFLINRNEKHCSKSNILTMDHKLILENSSSNAVNTQLNAIIFLKAVKYVNIRLRQIYCIKQTWNLSKGVKDWVWNGLLWL